MILVTGSSGTLGAALVRRLRREGRAAIGLDPVPTPTTAVVGSVADRALVGAVVRDHDVRAIVHAGALHKPQVATHSQGAFLAVNVQGTLNLLEAAAESAAVDRFVFTSTTSLMIDRQIRAGKRGGARRAAWLTEAHAPLRPRNIYGVTKLAAEHLCRLHHDRTGLPIVILRTARFFPEEDDCADQIVQSGPNTKTNELLFRRLVLDDVVAAHLAALRRAPALGFDTLIVSAPTPFTPAHREGLVTDAPAVVAALFPRYPAIYRELGWTMFDHIDRVYVAARAEAQLGFRCQVDFAEALRRLAAGEDPATVVGHAPPG